jgi:hypothetical protein
VGRGRWIERPCRAAGTASRRCPGGARLSAGSGRLSPTRHTSPARLRV